MIVTFLSSLILCCSYVNCKSSYVGGNKVKYIYICKYILHLDSNDCLNGHIYMFVYCFEYGFNKVSLT